MLRDPSVRDMLRDVMRQAAKNLDDLKMVKADKDPDLTRPDLGSA